MSMASMRRSTAFTSSGSVRPSIHRMSTGVTLWRPTSSSLIFRLGARRRRRTKEVLVRMDSTKESRGPLMGGSFSGSETERFSSVPVLKERQTDSPGKSSRQLPPMRSKTASSMVVRSSTLRL